MILYLSIYLQIKYKYLHADSHLLMFTKFGGYGGGGVCVCGQSHCWRQTSVFCHLIFFIRVVMDCTNCIWIEKQKYFNLQECGGIIPMLSDAFPTKGLTEHGIGGADGRNIPNCRMNTNYGQMCAVVPHTISFFKYFVSIDSTSTNIYQYIG